MDPRMTIDTYVSDVVRRLPRRQRNDVGFELRSLLNEELSGRAEAAGQQVDSAMVMQLLTAFGRPQDVADRYRPAGFTIIRPSDAPRFAWIALGGVALQWAITLPLALVNPVWTGAPGTDDGLNRLAAWWLTAGIGSFWWPGLLVTFSIIGAAVSHKRAGARDWTPPRAVDRDLVNRPMLVLFIVLGIAGAAMVMAVPWLSAIAPGLPQPLLTAFIVDSEFLAWRAPWVIVGWLASLVIAVAVLVAGRWSVVTRRASIIVGFGWLALLVWWILAGPIFVAAYADEVVKTSLIVVGLFTVLGLVLDVRAQVRTMRVPTAPTTP